MNDPCSSSGDSGPTGFVTPSDLSRQAGRAAFYARIAALEVALAELLRVSRHREEQRELLRHLTRTSKHNVECGYLVAREEDVEVDYVAYMTLTDLLDAVGGENDLRVPLGFPNKTRWNESVGGLPGLRNDVMHATREFLSSDRDFDKAIGYWDLIGQLVEGASEAISAMDGMARR